MTESRPKAQRLARKVLKGETIAERDAYLLIKAAKDDGERDLQLALERLLDHPVELVRQSALDAIVYGERGGKEHLSKALEMLRSDSDAGTRAYAAVAVAALSRRYGSQEAVPALIQALRDSDEHNKVRLEAYNSLLSITGAPTSEISRADPEAWDPERDVDWDWIRYLENRDDDRAQ
jgi:HEAT repeat protein